MLELKFARISVSEKLFVPYEIAPIVLDGLVAALADTVVKAPAARVVPPIATLFIVDAVVGLIVTVPDVVKLADVVADSVVKAPVEAVEAPTVVPLIEPPVMATELAFCVDIVPRPVMSELGMLVTVLKALVPLALRYPAVNVVAPDPPLPTGRVPVTPAVKLTCDQVGAAEEPPDTKE